jgi:negative regulator of sigma E activity
MLANLITVGIVTTAASIIPQAKAFLLFNKDKELRKTIESYHGHILESQRVLAIETLDFSSAVAQAISQVVPKVWLTPTIAISPQRTKEETPSRQRGTCP